MRWEDLKVLLVRMHMTVTDLARELECARPSIYLAFSRGNRPGVIRRIEEFYGRHNSRRGKYNRAGSERKGFLETISGVQEDGRSVEERPR